MPNWTEEQKQTIELRGKNILVSAAAGSGKTTVLIERIKKFVIEEQTDVDRFLITTFTNAAAAEMKQRLEKAIRAELADRDTGLSERDRAFLLRQLQLLPAAAIGTFHSFALDIIKQYFYLTNLEPGFSVQDETQGIIMQNDVIDTIFEEKYASGSEEFFDFLIRHSSDRNDNHLKQTILSTYNALRSIPHYMDWAKKQTALMGGDKPGEALGLYDFIADESAKVLPESLRYFEEAAELLNTADTPKLYAKAAEDAEIIRKAMETGLDYDGMREFLGHKYNTMSAGKDEKEAYEAVKDEVAELRKDGKKALTKIKEKYYQRTAAEYDEEINCVADDTTYLVGLIEDFESAYREAKAEVNVIDFDDAMHYVIDILDNERAAAEQRARFKYIFVDEYQDSNMLQEEIVNKIARDDNRFMVGDVKQSIYKFRLAEPELFLAKTERYNSDAEPNSLVINLNNNYRSKKRITDAVNAIFKNIMGGYDENAQLYCTVPEEFPGYKTKLHIINRQGFGEDDPEREEAECAVIASIIKEAHGSEIYNPQMGTTRRVEYRDIAVLAKANKTVASVERYLNNEGIPAYGETGEGYYETVEILVFLNLLRVIDNMRQDVPLISVMRSAYFDFSAAQLAKIRINQREGSFCSAVRDYRENGPDASLREKIAAMENQVELWKETGKAVPLEELVRMLLYDTGYYDYCSGLPAGKQRASNLQIIVEKAAKFEKTNHSGLNGFLKYVEAMADSNTSEAEAKTISENEDVVRVMTVHKSKGLEFPVVILTSAGSQISGGGNKNNAPMHKSCGMGLPLVNPQEHWRKKTLLQNVIGARHSAESLEEAKRVLYVALTRAKDRLEIVGSVGTDEELHDFPGTNSYLDMMYASLKDMPGCEVEIIDSIGQPGTPAPQGSRIANLMERMKSEPAGPEDELYSEIDRRLSYEYDAGEGEPVKLKYSVTELNSSGHYPVPIATFEPDMVKHKLTAAETGTVMHLVMEKLDFAKAQDLGEAYIASFVDALEASGKITPEERQAVMLDKIAGFFETEIGQRAAKAYEDGGLLREKEFILEKELRGEKTIVQGVIDCYFEEDSAIVLIDYKNSYMGGGRTLEDIRDTYADQVDTYREALEGATGKKVRESYLFLFDIGQFVEM